MSVNVIVRGNELCLGDRVFRSALGHGGVSTQKKEGDGCTPVGTFPLREAFYRPDRFSTMPICSLPLRAIERHYGWCDDPGNPRYNQFVLLPYAGRHEELWREDKLYDLVVVIGYNDDPVKPWAGSAIFLHVARDNYGPTTGCVSIATDDLLVVMEQLSAGSTITIS